MNKKQKKEQITYKKCYVCGEEVIPELELFQKYHKGNICEHCSREQFEDEIGYKND